MGYLLFQVFSVLQGWGASLRGDYLRTLRRPTKSNIVGMVAGAMGISRGDEKKLLDLQDQILYACRIDARGVTLEDYQIAKVPVYTKGRPIVKEDQKYYSNVFRKYYLCNAHFTVCLRSNKKLLMNIQDALQDPVYQVYFGRAACIPDAPLLPKIIQTKSLADAFERYPVPDVFDTILTEEVVPVFWEGDDKSINIIDTHSVQDKLVSRKNWGYIQREEYEGMISLSKEGK